MQRRSTLQSEVPTTQTNTHNAAPVRMTALTFGRREGLVFNQSSVAVQPEPTAF
jgi:hypothetical protein